MFASQSQSCAKEIVVCFSDTTEVIHCVGNKIMIESAAAFHEVILTKLPFSKVAQMTSHSVGD